MLEALKSSPNSVTSEDLGCRYCCKCYTGILRKGEYTDRVWHDPQLAKACKIPLEEVRKSREYQCETIETTPLTDEETSATVDNFCESLA